MDSKLLAHSACAEERASNGRSRHDASLDQHWSAARCELGNRVVVHQVSTRRIKVMLAIHGLGLGGAEMVVRDLARFLDRDRFDVCIRCTRGLGGSIGEELARDGFDVFVLPGRPNGRTDYLTALKFRRAVKQRDRAHSRDGGSSGCRPVQADDAPLEVVHTFPFGNYPYDSWRYHIMEGLGARTVDKLIAVGWEQRRQIQAAYRLSDTGIGMIGMA